MERAKKPVTASISSEDSTGSISAVSRRREPYYKQSRLGIAEAGYGLAPVLLIGKAADLFTRYLLAPVHQARAKPARYDFVLQSR
jgi:hypothetical protein